jgi:hypothetical protein
MADIDDDVMLNNDLRSDLEFPINPLLEDLDDMDDWGFDSSDFGDQ